MYANPTSIATNLTAIYGKRVMITKRDRDFMLLLLES